MKEPVPVLCAANAAYVMPLCVMFASLLTHFDRERALVIHLVQRDFTDREREQVEQTIRENRAGIESLELVWHTIDPMLMREDIPVHPRITADTLSRLSAPQLLARVDRALYLDSDLVVLADVAALYDSAPAGFALSAAHEISVPFVSSPRGVFNYRDEGLPPGTRYFNAGVLVMDLKKWREDRTAEQVLAYLRLHFDKIHLLEQGALNAVLGGCWHEYDPAWNQQWDVLFPELWERAGYARRQWRKVFVRPRIVHFSGDDKPWNRDNHAPRASFFFRYLKKTPFRGTVKKSWAARIEGVIGFRAYYHLWRIARQVACRLRGNKGVEGLNG